MTMEQERWTMQARPLDEVLLESRMQPDTASFVLGASALHAMTYGMRGTSEIAARLACPEEEIIPAITYVSSAYNARTPAQAVAGLIDDRVIPYTLLQREYVDNNSYMPWRSWQLVTLAAEGHTDPDIARIFSQTSLTSVNDVKALWQDTCSALNTPGTGANQAAAVRRAYEFGQLKPPKESSVMVFTTDKGKATTFTPDERDLIVAVGNGMSVEAYAEHFVTPSTTLAKAIDRVKRARQDIVSAHQALSLNEVVTKYILTTVEPTPLTAAHADVPNIPPKPARLLANLAVGYDLRQSAVRVGLGYNSARIYLSKIIFPTLQATKQGQAIRQAFKTGLFVAGEQSDSERLFDTAGK
ncbi:MAG TPA: hypothetical protein VD735_04715 [Candidatus Saccharimonadales bacterium]|nr:hypothetical protein [Candidatus Saccharimonadales bacterium]